MSEAQSAHLADLDAASLPAVWALPFGGLLLSIALLPLLLPTFWHRQRGWIAAFWAGATVVPLALRSGAEPVTGVVLHTLLADYLPFVVLLGSLFVVAGGVHLRGSLGRGAEVNLGLLATGSLLASVIGTTGASMLLVRPLMRANENRPRCAHVLVFFIFVVGNIGGALTPLGDPPVFLGFLLGVDFFWTTRHLGGQTLFLLVLVLGVFYAVDRQILRRDGRLSADQPSPARGLGVEGGANLLLLLLVVAIVLASGLWKSGTGATLLGVERPLEQWLRDGSLLAVAALSLAITPAGVRRRNDFSWAPMTEVATLFVGLFLTMIPVLAMLQAGPHAAFGDVFRAVSDKSGQPMPWAYFWASGVFSAFLDNAPTYLVFFNLAGGQVDVLTTTHAATLAAISAGCVFMGAATYIGNAPNLMIKAIAEQRGIAMPGFFGYMAWSGCVLMPMFVAVSWIWFR